MTEEDQKKQTAAAGREFSIGVLVGRIIDMMDIHGAEFRARVLARIREKWPNEFGGGAP